MALIPEPNQNVYEPITSEEAVKALNTGVWSNDAALKLVTQDADRAENFESAKQWVLNWDTASILYQSPAATKYWEGTLVKRANVPLFLLATAVNSLVPQIIKGMFFEDPPFQVTPRPKTTNEAARACSDVISYELDSINFREQLRLGCLNCLLFGTGIWKYGWESFVEEDFVVKRKSQPLRVKDLLGADIDIYDEEEELEEEVIENQIERPTFENITNLRHVLVDPGLREPNIQNAKYVVHRMYTTITDLEKIRNRPGVHLPSQVALIQLMFPPKEIVPIDVAETRQESPLLDASAAPRYESTSADPLQEPLELLERWDNNRYILVLDRKLVLASTRNPFQEIPFLSVGWWDVPEAFWSMGLAKTVGSEQRLQQGINNAWLDTLALMLNGVYVRVKGESVPTQNIRMAPGHVIDVDSKDSLKPLTRPDAVPEVGRAIEMSNSRLEQTSGASEFAMQGVAGSSGHSNLARSATGANLLAGGSGSRVDDFVEKLSSQVVVPFLYKVHALNRRLMTLSSLKRILSDELGHAYMENGENDPLDLLNAKLDFEVSAGAKLQSRRNMAQSIPIIIQFLESAPITKALAIEGKKVSVEEIIHMIFEVSHWKNFNDVIVPMTQDDMQRWQQSQPGAAAAEQMKGKMVLQQNAQAAKAQLANDENIARAGREVLRQAYEKATGPLAVTGEPGGQGFGANA